jgi:hypothetical protein
VHAEEAEPKQDAAAAMEMHHMHILVNHGLEMLMGANLIMLAEMKMSPGLDRATLNHGRSMMEQGKKTILQILSGPAMQEMHKGGKGEDPLMEYTHALATTILKVSDMLEKMEPGEMAPDVMTMHHFHMLINHALEMASQGSNLIMVGQMGMAKELDSESVEHGRKMLTDARTLTIEIMTSKAMSQMHGHEAAKSSEMMGSTHKLAAAALEVFDLLDRMPQRK